jgi:FkbM family methyltransferase
MTLRESWRATRGVARSLGVYYGDRERRAAMDRFYAAFVRPHDLVFDIGAHVGDRTACFRRLGARVIAVEPQPALLRTLRWLYGRDAGVVIEPLAVSSRPGRLPLRLNLDNPTVSTASPDLIEAAAAAPAWRGQIWDRSIDVTATTLDDLIARHGKPHFIKLDVEGLEAQALAGLSQPVHGLSFEFTTIQRGVALACLERCAGLGYARYNAVLGENLRYEHARWCNGEDIAHWLSGLPEAANSGDVYALLS